MNKLKLFTVLLAVPDDIAEGSTPREDTYLAHVDAANPVQAGALARDLACGDHEYDGDPADYAVLAIFHGHHDDLATG